MIYLLFITIIAFIALAGLLLYYLFKSPKGKEMVQTLREGLKEGLRGCGFHIK